MEVDMLESSWVTRAGMMKGQIAAYIGSLYGKVWEKDAKKDKWDLDYYKSVQPDLTQFNVHVDADKNEVKATSVGKDVVTNKALFSFKINADGETFENIGDLPYSSLI
jgi:hypothetical protein